MELDNQNGKMIISGVVKGLDDIQAFEEAVDTHTRMNKNLILEFVDAYTLPSSLIGYLNKKIHVDKITLTFIVHQDELYELIKILALDELFHIKKV